MTLDPFIYDLTRVALFHQPRNDVVPSVVRHGLWETVAMPFRRIND
jgi:hypothetical protein